MSATSDLAKEKDKIIEKLQAKIERLRTALKYYADKTHMVPMKVKHHKGLVSLTIEDGTIAREALNNEPVASGSGAMEESQ